MDQLDDEEVYQSFTTLVVSQVATGAHVLESQVHILSVKAGSIVADVRVDGLDSAAEAVAFQTTLEENTGAVFTAHSSDGFILGPAEVKRVTVFKDQNPPGDTKQNYPPTPDDSSKKNIPKTNDVIDDSTMMLVIIICAALGVAGLVGAGIHMHIRRQSSVLIVEAEASDGVSHVV